MTHAPRIMLSGLTFTGEGRQPAGVSFNPELNVLWGASNTGKSFTVKTVDFMLGGGSALPSITERDGYDRAWLNLRLPKSGEMTFMRALAGVPLRYSLDTNLSSILSARTAESSRGSIMRPSLTTCPNFC